MMYCRPDVIVNAAAFTDVDGCERDPAACARANRDAVGWMAATGARLVQVSTDYVFDGAAGPYREEDAVAPLSVYGRAKLDSEALTLAYHRYHGVNTKIVRIFNTYGPRMRLRDGRAVPAFMSQALNNEDVTVFGDGTQTRSFCYVTDLVDGVLRLADATTHDPVNIGNPHEVTIEEIARTIIRLVGSKSQIVYRPLPVDDPKQRRPDITRARTLLEWEPKIGLEEGLLKTVDYFKSRLR